jgi:hypothetical protein
MFINSIIVIDLFHQSKFNYSCHTLNLYMSAELKCPKTDSKYAVIRVEK